MDSFVKSNSVFRMPEVCSTAVGTASAFQARRQDRACAIPAVARVKMPSEHPRVEAHLDMPRLDRLPQINRNNLLAFPAQVNDTSPFARPARPLSALRRGASRPQPVGCASCRDDRTRA